MYESINLFRASAAMAKNAGMRQTVIAQNIANADTPGYRARTIAPFSVTYASASATPMRTTRNQHISPTNGIGRSGHTQFSDAEPAPNGNSVSIEEEMLNAVSVSREHDRAIAIYRHGMTVLRTTLGR